MRRRGKKQPYHISVLLLTSPILELYSSPTPLFLYHTPFPIKNPSPFPPSPILLHTLYKLSHPKIFQFPFLVLSLFRVLYMIKDGLLFEIRNVLGCVVVN